MQSIHLELRQTQQGRDGITAMLADENETVRQWSAGNALAWAPDVARPVLEAMARSATLTAFETEITLREFDAGRLDTTWQPKRRPRATD